MSSYKDTTKNFLLGKFHKPGQVINSVKALQGEGFSVYDVYSPFPIHGLDRILGIKRSRLTIAAFLFGMTGTCTALSMMLYMMYFDWPMDIGGKPSYLAPAAVPVSFELTVLFAAFGMVFTFFAVSKMYPGKKPVIMDPRVTDDVMVLAIEKSAIEEADQDKIEGIMMSHGAFEISEKTVHNELFEV
ncbi:MAG: DUF3341 domain-containing protein [Bacteroidia bacterium]|nr:DUF3341 domain-containing protein [Bacteroidia bacterium]